jgi:hypothetical protein
MFVKVGNRMGISYTHNNLGVIYEETGDLEKAISSYLASFKIDKELGDKFGMASAYLNLAEIYTKTSRLALAQEHRDLFDPTLIDPAFDVAYPDGSTLTSIQREIATAVALNARGLPTTMHLADPENMGTVQACWDPSGPAPTAAELAAMQALHTVGFNPRYQLNGSWSPAQGSPVTITWSLVPDGLNIPSGNGEPAANSTLFANMDSRFASQGGRATWIAQFEAVFARWSAISGINYVRVSAPGQPWDDGAAWGSAGNGTTRGDVRVSSNSGGDDIDLLIPGDERPLDGLGHGRDFGHHLWLMSHQFGGAGRVGQQSGHLRLELIGG